MAAGLTVEKVWAVFLLLVNSAVHPPAEMKPAVSSPPSDSAFFEESIGGRKSLPARPAEGVSERAFREIQAHLALSRSA